MVRRTALLFFAVQLGLAATVSAQAYNSVTLAWDANTEPDVAGYIVYWGNGSRTYDRSANVGNVTQFTINGLADLQTYYFAVRAYNTDGLQSPYSSEVSKVIPLNPDRVLGGHTRLFWQNETTGALAVWHMDGNRLIDGGAVSLGTVPDLNWKLVGSADFNADGYSDLVWHHAVMGWIAVWFMGGDTRLEALYATPDQVNPVWRLCAIGDFNRDGSPDFIWQHRDEGRVGVWLMRGTTLVQALMLTPDQIADTNWKIVGTGDYDLDGHTDLFWRHDVTGALAAWRMNGTTMVGGGSLTPGTVADTTWRIVALTDFNADARPDLVWQNDNGSIGTWIMNGVNRMGGPPLIPSGAPVGWRIIGAGR